MGVCFANWIGKCTFAACQHFAIWTFPIGNIYIRIIYIA